MRSLFRLVIGAAALLALAIGGFVIMRGGPGPITAVSVTTIPADSALADIDARRAALEKRIADGRHNGQLKGLRYLSLLDEQHRLLVAQKRAEAQGLTPETQRKLLADLERASANIDKHLRP